MVSIWWVACAFLLGGIAGLVVFAFMNMAARQNERAVMSDVALQRQGLGAVNLEEHWTT
jgi:RsiW-degrading membrane proteinase PrsW (M82 family)